MTYANNSETVEHSFTKRLLKAMPGFPKNAIRELEDVSGFLKYEEGDEIIKEGRPSDGIFLLLAGTTQPSMLLPGSISRKTMAMPSISAPAVLGTASCMLGEPSALSISASTPIEALFIPQADLLSVLREFPEAGLSMSQLVSEELARTYAHLSGLRGGSLPKQSSPLLN